MCVCIHEIIGLVRMKMKMNMKNKLHRYEINIPFSRKGHKYSKYKKCFSMIILVGIRQHLCNIWSSIYEKVKQKWGWVEKKRVLHHKAAVYASAC